MFRVIITLVFVPGFILRVDWGAMNHYLIFPSVLSKF